MAARTQSMQSLWQLRKNDNEWMDNRNIRNSLERACPCRPDRGELEQIRIPLGQMSVQTMERYLGWQAADS
jgi:hypothetical protein